MKRSIFLFLFLTLTVVTSCTTNSRYPNSELEEKRMDKQIERLNHHLHRSGAI